MRIEREKKNEKEEESEEGGKREKQEKREMRQVMNGRRKEEDEGRGRGGREHGKKFSREVGFIRLRPVFW